MPDPTILATWISAVSIGVAALTGLVNLVVTVTLALSVQGFSRRVTETQILQRANGQWQHYYGSWKVPTAPATPSGGTTVDDVARATIAALVTALRTAGIFS